jgi:hypothetical protein
MAHATDAAVPAPDVAGLDALPKPAPTAALPRTKASHGLVMQVLRGFAFVVYFWTCCIV